MTGQIPKYGKHFRLESTPYHTTMANRVYVLKADANWYIRSDKTSKIWQLFYRGGLDVPMAFATCMGKPQPSLTEAMGLLLDGIEYGFYAIRK